jgi:hypothetical protein
LWPAAGSDTIGPVENITHNLEWRKLMESFTLTVSQLIEKLEKVENKDAGVTFLDPEGGLIVINSVLVDDELNNESVVLTSRKFVVLD